MQILSLVLNAFFSSIMMERFTAEQNSC